MFGSFCCSYQVVEKRNPCFFNSWIVSVKTIKFLKLFWLLWKTIIEPFFVFFNTFCFTLLGVVFLEKSQLRTSHRIILYFSFKSEICTVVIFPWGGRKSLFWGINSWQLSISFKYFSLDVSHPFLWE